MVEENKEDSSIASNISQSSTTAAHDKMKCPICYNDFDDEVHRPVTGVCQHTLCLDCYKEVVRTDSLIRCPNCRELLGRISCNFAITHLIGPVKKDNAAKKKSKTHQKKLVGQLQKMQALVEEMKRAPKTGGNVIAMPEESNEARIQKLKLKMVFRCPGGHEQANHHHCLPCNQTLCSICDKEELLYNHEHHDFQPYSEMYFPLSTLIEWDKKKEAMREPIALPSPEELDQLFPPIPRGDLPPRVRVIEKVKIGGEEKEFDLVGAMGNLNINERAENNPESARVRVIEEVKIGEEEKGFDLEAAMGDMNINQGAGNISESARVIDARVDATTEIIEERKDPVLTHEYSNIYPKMKSIPNPKNGEFVAYYSIQYEKLFYILRQSQHPHIFIFDHEYQIWEDAPITFATPADKRKFLSIENYSLIHALSIPQCSHELYLIGGRYRESGTESPEVLAIDVDILHFEQYPTHFPAHFIRPLPEGRCNFAAIHVKEVCSIFVIGGRRGNEILTSTVIYDIGRALWYRVAKMQLIVGLERMGTVQVVDRRGQKSIRVYGGYDAQGRIFKDIHAIQLFYHPYRMLPGPPAIDLNCISQIFPTKPRIIMLTHALAELGNEEILYELRKLSGDEQKAPRKFGARFKLVGGKASLWEKRIYAFTLKLLPGVTKDSNNLGCFTPYDFFNIDELNYESNVKNEDRIKTISYEVEAGRLEYIMVSSGLLYEKPPTYTINFGEGAQGAH